MEIMSSKIAIGNIAEMALSGDFDVVIHGCNCQNSTGSGVAEAMFTAFPCVKEADQKTKAGDASKIGTYSYAVTQSKTGSPLVIVNGYTQVFYGRQHYKGPPFDIESFERLLSSIMRRFGGRGLRIAYPLIGSDRGKANPEQIYNLINTYFEGENHTLVLFSEPGRNQKKFIVDLRNSAMK